MYPGLNLRKGQAAMYSHVVFRKRWIRPSLRAHANGAEMHKGMVSVPQTSLEVEDSSSVKTLDYSVVERSAEAYQAKQVTRNYWNNIPSQDAVIKSSEEVGELRRRNRCRISKEFIRLKRKFGNFKNYENQAGVASRIDTVKSIVERLTLVSGMEVTQSTLYHIERFVSLYFAMSRCVDAVQGIAIAELYLSGYYSASIVETVINCMTTMSEVENQAGELSGTPDWLKLLKQAQSNWKLVINNEGFGKLSHLLSMMLSLGLCDSTGFAYTVAGMRLFSIEACKKQVNALDLGDAIFDTIVYFVEGGYECFAQGSFKPLLYGDMDMQKLEEDIAKIEQYSEYAKTGDLEKRVNMSPNDFDYLLVQTLEKMQVLLKTTRNGIVSKIIRDKVDKIRRIQTYFRQTRVEGGLREAPFNVKLFGTSGVGKSSLAQILMVTLLMYNGYSAEDDKLITLNDGDKYMSNYRSYINGIFFDDVGNTKQEFREKASSSKFIEILNNVRTYANMAEADLKGKVSIEPKVCVATTNKEDLCAREESNEPVSILRRFHYHVSVRVKKQFSDGTMLNSEKVKTYFQNDIPLLPDIWELDVSHYVGKEPPMENLAQIPEKIMDLENASLEEVIRFLTRKSDKHFAEQNLLVVNNTNLAKKLTLCKHCKLPETICRCEPEDEEEELEDQAGIIGTMLAPVAWDIYSRYNRKFWNKFYSGMNMLEQKTTLELISGVQWLEESRWCVWTNWLPTNAFQNEYVRDAILSTSDVGAEVKSAVGMNILYLFLVFCMAIFYSKYCVLFGYFPISRLFTIVETQKEMTYKRICEENANMPEIFKKHRDSSVQYIVGACSAVAFIYMLAQTYKLIKIIPEAEGNLMPTSIHDIEQRDAEKQVEDEIAVEMAWEKPEITPLPVHTEAKTATLTQLDQMVWNNLGLLTYVIDGKTYGCDIFFIESNVAIIPKHMWKTKCVKALIRRKETQSANFEALLDRTYSVDLEGSDLSLVYIPNGGSCKNLSKYLPFAPLRDIPAKLIYKAFTSEDKIIRKESPAYMRFGDVGNAAQQFYGAEYTLDFTTFVGLCMATLISDTKEASIVGFHLGGRGQTGQGVCGTIFYDQYLKARESLQNKKGVVIAASAGTMKTNLYDVEFFESPVVHDKSPVNECTDGHFEVYGSCKGRATYYSKVVDTPIKSTVEKVCGVESKFGKPKFYLGNAWKNSLKVSSNPSIGMEGELLEKAVDDYVVHMVKKIDTIPELRDYIRPLEEIEVICGIDGVRFIDKISGKTAIGFPLSGSKEPWLKPLDIADFPDYADPKELDEQFWKVYYECEEEWRSGRRCHIAFKACLKDEPTKLTKDKVRVFQAAPIHLQIGIRKYFLPLVRLLSLFPLDSECAVGINCMGPEWDTLARHMNKFGLNRIFAGDFAKYDLRMPAELTLAAFSVLLYMAEYFGYCDDALVIMRGIATDVCYPVMAYNGDLIQLFGSNPSGQNLTVYINSIVNSLLMRCAYFHLEGMHAKPFRDNCAMGTYGDDVKGSTHPDVKKFHIVSYIQFLKDRDIVFTMPDKESEPVPLMNDADADFLKRKNVWNPILGAWQGALSEESIFKALMTVLESKALTGKEQVMGNIDGALREWVQHGREVYTLRNAQMNEIAEIENLPKSAMPMLAYDYDECMRRYCLRYMLGFVEDETDSEPEIEYEEQSGELRTFVHMKVPRQSQRAILNAASFVYGLGFATCTVWYALHKTGIL